MSGTAAALPSGLRRCLAGYLGGNWERGAFGARLAVGAWAVYPMRGLLCGRGSRSTTLVTISVVQFPRHGSSWGRMASSCLR